MKELNSVAAGDTFFGDINTNDVYCILGSCVGLLYFNEDTIGITHGRLPTDVTPQIEDALKNVTNHTLVLYGGMEGQIGDMNINAARNALRGVKYQDKTGHAVTVKNTEGLIIIEKIKDIRGE
jgi:hypothetical protein